jgi:hypothetical protein
MRVLQSIQIGRIDDPVRSKFAMVAPVIEATLYSLRRDRVERLGGYDKVTVEDLAIEMAEGDGDAGICFEYAVHEAIANEDPLIHPLASEVLEQFCGIGGGSASILFGPEKDGAIPIIESVQDALTEDSRVYVGNRGQPAKLKAYIPQIVRAFRRNEERNKLPRSISGLWKADLFLGNPDSEKWVGTTVKSNATGLVGAQGLRIGIYPKVNAADAPRKDDDLNLIRLPLPYDGAFMELFWKSFFLTRAFFRARGKVPPPISLPDAEDRFITEELAKRAAYPVRDVVGVIRDMSQRDLLKETAIEQATTTTSLSEATGLADDAPEDDDEDPVSITPKPLGDA